MKSFEKDGLSISVTPTRQGMMIVWLGTSDARDVATSLEPFFTALVGSMKSKEVTIDFRGLEYMNSATVSPIMSLIKRLDVMEVKSTLWYDANIGWQRVNLQCMKAIARTLRHLEVVDKPR